ncbi:N-(5'-phosphoribosyl) anthranilate isomerase [Parvularcula bermudensis HTCC2503]|uniref:N-(5'-phosphoribosyl)anthranilate isomerase n=1 Tax=Parvularcula bermudensis (strain ATCC BAA-594 / HTCC2503 / KCTC 12087) TaxID=314260 RepID=E0TF77_PARBH|nr:phosphoribosylanthranilate isomerase [Parvularcula bermudensis]ADM08995.1 N-(5'-phosphoribosyl) anthranilate isomerase [Parvularcula bermudensis HTCC2503]
MAQSSPPSDPNRLVLSGEIKICGLRSIDMIETAAQAGASLAGFVFVPASPRYVGSLAEAKPLVDAAKALGLRAVALVAGQGPDALASLAQALPLDALQLHGAEEPALVEAIGAAVHIPILAARAVSTARDIGDDVLPRADGLLFDAKPPEGARYQGGHGTPFDWSVLAAYRGSLPFLLAGGLTPENVTQAIRVAASHPQFAGVDVSSGVEAEKGQKDPAKIVAFVERARAAMRDARPL